MVVSRVRSWKVRRGKMCIRDRCRLITENENALSLDKINRLYGCCFNEEAAFNVAVSNLSILDEGREMNTISVNVYARIEEQFRQHIMPLCCECQAVVGQEQLLFLLNYEPAVEHQVEAEINHVIEKLQRNMELMSARITIGLGSGRGKDYPQLYSCLLYTSNE